MDNSKPFTWAADLLSKTEGPYIKDVTRYEQIYDLLSEAQREEVSSAISQITAQES